MLPTTLILLAAYLPIPQIYRAKIRLEHAQAYAAWAYLRFPEESIFWIMGEYIEDGSIEESCGMMGIFCSIYALIAQHIDLFRYASQGKLWANLLNENADKNR